LCHGTTLLCLYVCVYFVYVSERLCVFSICVCVCMHVFVYVRVVSGKRSSRVRGLVKQPTLVHIKSTAVINLIFRNQFLV